MYAALNASKLRDLRQTRKGCDYLSYMRADRRSDSSNIPVILHVEPQDSTGTVGPWILNDEREYFPPWRSYSYPFFAGDDLRSLQKTLTGRIADRGDPEDWVSSVYTFYGRRKVLLVLLAALFVVSAFSFLFIRFSLPLVLIFLSLVPTIFLLILLGIALYSPRIRFFRYMASAERMANASSNFHHRYVRSLNQAGRAARMLFLEFQRSRRSWLSPPAVADSALYCAAQLINVYVDKPDGVSKGEFLQVYRRFLRDVTCLVIVGREDLIPALRARYENLKPRDNVGEGIVPEAEARFLDPTRNMNRWEVRKEFYYPLATWLSAIVAIAALLVSIAKSR